MAETGFSTLGRFSRKPGSGLVTVFVVGFVLCALSSYFTTLGTPVLVGVIVLGVLFLPEFKELFVILFPLTLINPQLRFGPAGMVVSEERSFHPININMTELFIAGIIVAWLLGGRDREGERAGKFLNVPTAILIVLSFVGMIVGVERASAVKLGFEKMIEPLILFFAVTHIRWDRRKLQKAVTVLLSVGVVVALKSMYDWFFGPPPEPKMVHGREVIDSGRLKSFWGATNMVAAFFSMLTPIAFLRAFYLPSARGRLWAFIIFGILALGIAVTQTRAAWLAVALALALLSFRFRRGWFLLIVTAIVVGVFGTSDMLKRANTLLAVGSDASLLSRLVVWRDSIGMILRSPLYGIGFSSFYLIYRSPVGNVHPHNDLLGLGVEMGILAPLVFLFILVRILAVSRRALRLSSTLADRVMLWGLLAGVGATFIQSQMDCLMNWGNFSLAYWYVLGLTAAYARSIILDWEDAGSAALSRASVATPSAARPAAP